MGEEPESNEQVFYTFVRCDFSGLKKAIETVAQMNLPEEDCMRVDECVWGFVDVEYATLFCETLQVCNIFTWQFIMEAGGDDSDLDENVINN